MVSRPQMFDPNDQVNWPMEVKTALFALVNAIVNGGYEGGEPAAAWDFQQKLREREYPESYIQAALAEGKRLGEEGWKKKYGYS